MNSFTFECPTRIIFGRDVLEQLGPEVTRHARRVLLVTGGGSVRATGLFDRVVAELERHGVTYVELGGVTPNPRLGLVREGVDLCAIEGVELILAVGGGSVIDAAKAIAVGAANDVDVWRYFTREVDPATASSLPVGCVLTAAGSGSEMNANAVVTNEATQEKLVLWGGDTFPRFSILDPELTFTVPRSHTVYGTVDMIVHCLEQYFSAATDTPLQDRLLEGVVRTAVENVRVVIVRPDDYAARSNLMWCGSLACSFLLGQGKLADWGTHKIEEQIGGMFDVPHGAGLSTVFPSWMRYVIADALPLFRQYAVRVWDVDPTGRTDEEVAREGVDRTEAFFREIGSPVSLRELGVDPAAIGEISERVTRGGPLGNLRALHREDVAAILAAAV